MGTINYAPLYRSSVGFDRLLELLDGAARYEPVDNYPPYNIEKLGEDSYRITMAVAGFSADELTVTAQPNLLMVAGHKGRPDNAQYLHHGLATRDFERRFDLADHVEVKTVALADGLLSVDLVREVPAAMKPRKISITQGEPAGEPAGGPAGPAAEPRQAA